MLTWVGACTSVDVERTRRCDEGRREEAVERDRGSEGTLKGEKVTWRWILVLLNNQFSIHFTLFIFLFVSIFSIRLLECIL